MPLSDDQNEQLHNWVNAKGIEPHCSACGSNNWAPGEVISAPVFQGKDTAISGPSVPMVQLVCSDCAYVMLFAAVPMGLAG